MSQKKADAIKLTPNGTRIAARKVNNRWEGVLQVDGLEIKAETNGLVGLMQKLCKGWWQMRQAAKKARRDASGKQQNSMDRPHV